MRASISAIAILFFQNFAFSQYTEFADVMPASIFDIQSDLLITDSDDFYLGTTTFFNTSGQGLGEVRKKVGNQWLLLDSLNGYFTNDIENVTLDYDESGDELYIMITRADGFYSHIYNGTSMTAAYHYACDPGSDPVQTIMRSDSDQVFMSFYDNGIDNFRFLKFNGDNGSYDSLPSPADQVQGQVVFDLTYSPQNDSIYLAYQTGTPSIVNYNHLSWNPFFANICNLTGAVYNSVEMDYDPASNEIVIAYSTAGTPGSNLEVRRIQLDNWSLTQVYGPQDAMGVARMTEMTYNEVTQDIIFTSEDVADHLKNFYYCGDPMECGVIGVLPMYDESDMEHDSQGNVYWTHQSGTRLYIYQLDFIDVSISEQNGSEIKMFPNPSNSSVELTNSFPFHYSIYDLKGRQVLINSESSSSHTVDVSGITNGTYVVEFVTENELIYRKKLVVQH